MLPLVATLLAGSPDAGVVDLRDALREVTLPEPDRRTDNEIALERQRKEVEADAAKEKIDSDRAEAELKKRCGKDAHRMKSGMRFTRVKVCSGLSFDQLAVDAVAFKAYRYFDPITAARGTIQVQGDVVTVVVHQR